jgi:hypothetical protein
MNSQYSRIAQLAPNDQMLWADEALNYYLADLRGSSPANTDHGPLRIDVSRGMSVSTDSCTVTVTVEHQMHRKSQVPMSHAAGLALLEHIPRLKVLLTRSLKPLARLIHRAAADSLRFASNLDPDDPEDPRD